MAGTQWRSCRMFCMVAILGFAVFAWFFYRTKSRHVAQDYWKNEQLILVKQILCITTYVCGSFHQLDHRPCIWSILPRYPLRLERHILHFRTWRRYPFSGVWGPRSQRLLKLFSFYHRLITMLLESHHNIAVVKLLTCIGNYGRHGQQHTRLYG